MHAFVCARACGVFSAFVMYEEDVAMPGGKVGEHYVEAQGMDHYLLVCVQRVL